MTTKERLASLETQVKEIKDNHLTHLALHIDKLDTRLWWIVALIVSAWISMLGIAVAKLFF